MAFGIRITYTRNTCIGSTYTMDIRIGYIDTRNAYTGNICAKVTFVKSIELRVLAKLGVILANSKINNYWLWLLIELIFILINYMSY